jgi:fimbrial chaperone protein
VENDDEQKLSFQVRLFEWTQTAEGKDDYKESQDLIWFPQLFAIAPKEKRVIRVGLKGAGFAALPAEKAYRLFIEEIPGPAPAGAAPSIRIVLRFGVPLFAAPAVPRKSGVIEAVEEKPGKLAFRVRNDGTQSIKFDPLRLQRDADLIAEGQGWYVLAGATRAFEIAVDRAKCAPGTMEVVAASESLTLKQAFKATKVLCEHP